MMREDEVVKAKNLAKMLNEPDHAASRKTVEPIKVLHIEGVFAHFSDHLVSSLCAVLWILSHMCSGTSSTHCTYMERPNFDLTHMYASTQCEMQDHKCMVSQANS